MAPLIATLLTFTGALNDRRRRLKDDETGAVSVEQVLITIGLVALSVTVLAGIALYARNRVTDLND